MVYLIICYNLSLCINRVVRVHKQFKTMLDILLMLVSLTVIRHYDKCITRSQPKQVSNKQRSIFDSMKRSSNVKQKQPSSKKRKVVEESDIEISIIMT